MSEIAVSCKGIKKSFFVKDIEIPALRGIDLDIHKGEFMMLVGPSGCGKTTLISIIAGILKPSFGTCLVDSINLNQINEDNLLSFRAKKIGFIFQSFNLISTISIFENISMPLIINGTDSELMKRRVETILYKVGLGEKMNRSLNQLSGGEQQRVAIARALVHEPSIIICDEPTSALDHATGASIMELMKNINQELNTTFVVVTHDPRIYSYADRIAHMDDGRIDKIG